MGKITLACRVQSYAPFLAGAHGHLASLGIHHVEIPVPQPAEVDTVAAQLRRFELTATTLHGECDVRRPDTAAQVAAQMPALAALGARILFVSVKAEGTPLPAVYQRLKAAGEVAAQHGVTIALETHPDLVTNAATALATLRGVDHPNVRINFDTANIYFYNHDADAVAELRPIAPLVASVHLKDTNGGYRCWHFPALGRGVVNFGGVFEVLEAADFHGPCTLEIEGLEGEQKTERLVCDRIAESLGYLRGLGRV
jgi:sugar phosphate isomerase/epimerase